jgi:flagellar biosynthesis protein FlhF
MHVKRLYRPTVREALMAAKEELGPGALVLSTELVPARGWRGWMGQRVVRLTAAAERPPSRSERFGEPGPPTEPVDESDALSDDRPELPEIRPARSEPARIGTSRAGLLAKLAAVGLDEDLCNAVVDRLTDAECRGTADLALRGAIAAELEQIVGGDTRYARYEVFVGPPGVGKTTTIAKIAAQALNAGGPQLGLIAADGFRAGAVEQLRAYASIMGAPFRTARASDEYASALGSSRQTSLVDTAGRSPSDREITDLFDVLDRKRGVRTHLVLAADTSAAMARRIVDRYGRLRPARVVITKLDECESVMPLLGVMRERQLPVSYLSAGQRVPEDLARATPAMLAAALLGETALEAPLCHQ